MYDNEINGLALTENESIAYLQSKIAKKAEKLNVLKIIILLLQYQYNHIHNLQI